MFKTKSKSTKVLDNTKGSKKSNELTILGSGSEFKGELSSINVLVSGTQNGNIEVTESIRVSPLGSVVGDIKSSKVVIEGKVTGNITSVEVIIKKSGRVFGDINSENLTIDRGGTFQGTSKLNVNSNGNQYTE